MKSTNASPCPVEDPESCQMHSKVSAAHSVSMLMLYNANHRLRRLCFSIGDELIKHNKACNDGVVPLPDHCKNLAKIVGDHAQKAQECVDECQQVMGYLNAFVLVLKGKEVLLNPNVENDNKQEGSAPTTLTFHTVARRSSKAEERNDPSPINN